MRTNKVMEIEKISIGYIITNSTGNHEFYRQTKEVLQRVCSDLDPFSNFTIAIGVNESSIDSQARAWRAIYELCRTLGMQNSPSSGLEDVLNYIKELSMSKNGCRADNSAKRAVP